MNRATLKLINNDREIVNLRLQSEALINNIENLTTAEFDAEAKRIATEIETRILFLKRSIYDQD